MNTTEIYWSQLNFRNKLSEKDKRKNEREPQI